MNERIYLDYCATTPLHPEIFEAMLPAFGDLYGNASSMHFAGQEASRALQQAREQVAEAIGCLPAEIVFTSGATEANNLALLGVLRSYSPGKAHLITTAVEHHAVLHTAQQLEREGYAVTYLPVDGQGLIDLDALRRAVRPETVLISVMMVNNEVGTVQPVAEIGRIAREHDILLHVDAVQSMGLLDVKVDALAVDLLSLSGHKIYGPKGIGALYVREGCCLSPLMFGGHQENNFRPGTENIPGIIGLGAAVNFVCRHKTEEYARLVRLRKRLINGLRRRNPGLIVNGPKTAVAPHILSVSFPNTVAEMIMLQLNRRGIAVSLGSACTSDTIAPSHVLLAMNMPMDQIEGTLRISMGYPTEVEEIDRFIIILSEIAQQSLTQMITD